MNPARALRAPEGEREPGLEAVVSFLDETHDGLVRGLWAELERTFGLRGIYGAPYPHLSYGGALGFHEEKAEAALTRVAAELEPLTVRTTGVGLFTGERPILYLSVVKSPALMTLHARLLEELLPLATGANPHYLPHRWTPHITLAYGDLTHERVAAVVRHLSPRRFDWEVTLDNLALVYTEGQDQGVALEVAFGGGLEVG